MKTPIIKICGNTNLDDARTALECGADILGFIFYEKSPRYISPEKAKSINDILKKKIRYLSAGVFVNPPIEFVKSVLEKTNIDILQFHGDEPLSFIESMKVFKKKIIKAFRIKEKTDLLKCGEYQTINYFLLDTFSKDAYGGTGKVFDWTMLEDFKYRDRLFLSGGIGAHNVREAVDKVNPYAIDISSSLEKEPGKKDHEKIIDFFKAIKKDS